MIEVVGNYCHVLHTDKQFDWGNDMIRELANFRNAAASANDTKVIGFTRNDNMN